MTSCRTFWWVEAVCRRDPVPAVTVDREHGLEDAVGQDRAAAQRRPTR